MDSAGIQVNCAIVTRMFRALRRNRYATTCPECIRVNQWRPRDKENRGEWRAERNDAFALQSILSFLQFFHLLPFSRIIPYDKTWMNYSRILNPPFLIFISMERGEGEREREECEERRGMENREFRAGDRNFFAGNKLIRILNSRFLPRSRFRFNEIQVELFDKLIPRFDGIGVGVEIDWRSTDCASFQFLQNWPHLETSTDFKFPNSFLILSLLIPSIVGGTIKNNIVAMSIHDKPY